MKINIWICCKCKARDVALIEYTKDKEAQSSPTINKTSNFVPEDS